MRTYRLLMKEPKGMVVELQTSRGDSVAGVFYKEPDLEKKSV